MAAALLVPHWRAVSSGDLLAVVDDGSTRYEALRPVHPGAEGLEADIQVAFGNCTRQREHVDRWRNCQRRARRRWQIGRTGTRTARRSRRRSRNPCGGASTRRAAVWRHSFTDDCVDVAVGDFCRGDPAAERLIRRCIELREKEPSLEVDRAVRRHDGELRAGVSCQCGLQRNKRLVGGWLEQVLAVGDEGMNWQRPQQVILWLRDLAYALIGAVVERDWRRRGDRRGVGQRCRERFDHGVGGQQGKLQLLRRSRRCGPSNHGPRAKSK